MRALAARGHLRTGGVRNPLTGPGEYGRGKLWGPWPHGRYFQGGVLPGLPGTPTRQCRGLQVSSSGQRLDFPSCPRPAMATGLSLSGLSRPRMPGREHWEQAPEWDSSLHPTQRPGSPPALHTLAGALLHSPAPTSGPRPWESHPGASSREALPWGVLPLRLIQRWGQKGPGHQHSSVRGFWLQCGFQRGGRGLCASRVWLWLTPSGLGTEPRHR